MVPPYETAPVLVLVGALMFRTVSHLSLDRLEDAIPAYLTIVLIPLTFQITHATDADTNAERDFIIAELRNNRLIGDVNEIQAGQHIEHVNHYVTDGEIALANL